MVKITMSHHSIRVRCLALASSLAILACGTVFSAPAFAQARAPQQVQQGVVGRIVVQNNERIDSTTVISYLPIQPGTDVMLFNGMLHLMLWEGWTDAAWIAAHTSGFEALKACVRDCTPERVAQTCGITQQDLLQAARLFATSPATLSLYCQGLNQSSSGTAKNAALINLHLATAQIGKPGAGPFSLTGQPNAMGGREVGGMANLLSAHRDLANPQHRAEVAALWGVPSVPGKPGKTAVEMFQAAADGEIRALWIACTNPAQSMPDQATVRRAGGLLHRRHLPLRRSVAAGYHLGREDRYRDQQRAAHQPGARRRAAAGPDPPRLGDCHRICPPVAEPPGPDRDRSVPV